MFMAWLNRHTALCLKLHHGRTGCIWDASEKYSAVKLTTGQAVRKEIIYTATNPVTAGLISCASDWPGINLGPSQWQQGPLHTTHPGLFFVDNDNEHPCLTLTPPPCFQHGDTRRIVELLQGDIAQREQAISRTYAKTGRKFWGARRVIRQSIFSRPQTTHKHNNTNPTFAAVTREGIQYAKTTLRAFRESYEIARQRFIDGDRDVLFPPGTWLMVRHFGAQVSPALPVVL